ncbi:MAG TPA: TlyA family RNA methyltransferase [Candidatus Acidoferrales bacterium]|nr:TlyA family RNA methyltransferase [Candidatus Acidoferrales bacterium]
MKAKIQSRPCSTPGAAKIPKPAKSRLDVLIVERGLAPSRERAQALLLAGQVRVDGQRAEKPGAQVATSARIEIIGETLRYSSRGGLKLEGALQDFAVSPVGRTCLDVGSSTGGFTNCLLQHGATKVFAVDVTTNQLDWKLQQDPRVIMIERNARYLQPADLLEAPNVVTMDVSFISAAKVLPAIAALAAPGADILILVKPQFELDRGEIGKGGIVRDPALHEKAVERVRSATANAGLDILGSKPSRLEGAEGNREFFLHARKRV